MTRNLFIVVLVAILVSTLANGRYIADTKLSSYKRTSSDQRIAELQALIALSNTIGHGQVNPEEIGKKKRTDTSSVDFRRSLLVERLLRLAAEGLVNSV